MRGRPKVTGRFGSRRALEDRVVFLRGRGVFFKAIALHSGISVQSARDIYAAHLAGETVSARMAAGERMWDIENDLVDTEWDEFAPLDMMRFA